MGSRNEREVGGVRGIMEGGVRGEEGRVRARVKVRMIHMDAHVQSYMSTPHALTA